MPSRSDAPPSVQPEILQAVADHANDIILVTEAAPLSAPGPRITYVNPAFTELTGYEPEEVLGKNPRILQGPDTDEETLAEVRTALEREESIRVEILNYAKDDRPYWLEMDIAPVVDESGTCTHFIAIERDITDRKRREQQIEVLRDLLGHDLRKEIGKTVSWLDVAKTRGPSSKLRSPIQQAEDGASRAIDMIGTADALLKGYLQGQDLRTEPTDLRPHIEKVIQAISRRFPNGQISADLPAGEDLQVAANELLQSVLENLISNGLAHNGSETPKVRVRVIPKPDRIAITVADNGPGIPEAITHTLFGEGVQGTGSTGSGKGLFLAATLTELFGGDIRVGDREPSGTVFTVSLPRR